MKYKRHKKIEDLDELKRRVSKTALVMPQRRMALREWLQAMGLNIKDFARVLGVSRTLIWFITTGQENVSKTVMDKIKEVSLNRVSSPKYLLDKD